MRSALHGVAGAAFLALLLAGCAPGTRVTSAAPLDYGRTSNWAALPSKSDAADGTPVPSLQAGPAGRAAADVFYIHPTTYLSFLAWNATTGDEGLNRLTDRGPIRLQASAFNGCCRVFAPRYRQAALKAFFSGSDRGEEALDLAYADVRRAFLHYLAQHGGSRPFIIASHSQGTRHAVRLLREVVEPDPALRRRLVAAYLIGWPVPCDAFEQTPVCRGPEEVGCFVTWSTYSKGSKGAGRHSDAPACCVNPLTWRRDGEPASSELNLGGIPYQFDRLDPGLTSAQCIDGRLLVEKPDRKGYITLGRNLHLMDYNLFYANIRHNARGRVEAFLRGE